MRKSTTSIITMAIVICAVFLLLYILPKTLGAMQSSVFGNISDLSAANKQVKPPREYNDFLVYNYYRVPISVAVITDTDSKIIVSDIPPTGRKGISWDMVTKYIREGHVIKVYKTSDFNSPMMDWSHTVFDKGGRIDKLLRGTKQVQVDGQIGIEKTQFKYDEPVPNALVPIGGSILTIPEDKTITALHCGMSVGSTDIALSSDPVKSPLGTALSRLRIVNTTPSTIYLTTTGNNELIIPAGKSYLYYGQYENGIPLGTKIQDINGVLPTYEILVPMTDLFMGVISDIPLPLYNDIKVGLAFNDDPGIVDHALEIHNIQWHRGTLIDTSFIPKNW